MPTTNLRLICALLMVIFIIALTGCSQQQQIEKNLLAYQDRLSSFTGIEIEQRSDISIRLNAPAKNTLTQDIEQLFINLRELYALQECTLNQVVAERNTALGKMQLPSSRYAYEIALLKEIVRCKELLRNKSTQENVDALLVQLEAWEATKKQQLPYVWSNLITQSDELFLHMSSAPSYISGDETDSFIASKQAWAALSQHTIYFVDEKHPRTDSINDVKNSPYFAIDAEIKNLELHLQQLEQSRLLARMWKTQLLITKLLDNTTPLLEKYLDMNTCTGPQQASDIVIMRNIFTLFFAEEIQALAAELNKYHYQLFPLVSPLIDSNVLPPAYKDYLTQHLVSNHRIYKESMQNHIQKWQQIFARCD